MNRNDCKNQITELFENYVDGRMSLSELEIRVRATVDEFADDISDDLRVMREMLDKIG